MAVYLIHFDQKLGRSQHYIGFAEDVEAREAVHRATTWEPTEDPDQPGIVHGNGATLLGVCNHYGIDWNVVRVWPDGDRTFEHQLKNRKKARVFCPICQKMHMEGEEQC